MPLVWSVLPHYRMYTHQPVPEFHVASGEWLLWDRRRQQEQNIIWTSGRWKGSQPYICLGDGEIKTIERNVGAVHLFATPNTESLEAGQQRTITIAIGSKYSAKARFIRTQAVNGAAEWITHQKTNQFDYWVLEILADGQVLKSVPLHQPSDGVTFAAGIGRSNTETDKFYAWLSDGSKEHFARSQFIDVSSLVTHFGSGNAFLGVDFDDPDQVEETSSISVQGGMFMSPVAHLVNGFPETISLSPTLLETRKNDSHTTCHSLRQVSTNFLKPLFFGFRQNNGGQAETSLTVNHLGPYLPNYKPSSSQPYYDTLPYVHCIAGYKHSLSAPIPDNDGPPLHHSPAVRTRLKVLRVTPLFRIRFVQTYYDVPSTDLQIQQGSFGDWAGSQEIPGVGNVNYLISVHWAEQPTNVLASLEDAEVETESRVYFSYYINTQPGKVYFFDYGDSPVFGGFDIGNSNNLFVSQNSEGSFFEALREDFFNGESISFRRQYTTFTVQAVGT